MYSSYVTINNRKVSTTEMSRPLRELVFISDYCQSVTHIKAFLIILSFSSPFQTHVGKLLGLFHS